MADKTYGCRDESCEICDNAIGATDPRSPEALAVYAERALHAPQAWSTGSRCMHCVEAGWEGDVVSLEWPCPTIKALDGAE